VTVNRLKVFLQIKLGNQSVFNKNTRITFKDLFTLTLKISCML